MSKTTKKKHVTKEVMGNFVVPEANQRIAKILAGKGNNLHEVETCDGEIFLASMPTKFRKNVWIKRGDFIILDPIEEGDKVKAEIVAILYKEQIKHIKEEGKWPERFQEAKMEIEDDKFFPESDDDNDIINVNRNCITYDETDTDSSSDSDHDI